VTEKSKTWPLQATKVISDQEIKSSSNPKEMITKDWRTNRPTTKEDIKDIWHGKATSSVLNMRRQATESSTVSTVMTSKFQETTRPATIALTGKRKTSPQKTTRIISNDNKETTESPTPSTVI
jgi:hypothetical protein